MSPRFRPDPEGGAADDRLAAVEQALRQRERDLKNLLDHLPAMVGYWDTEQRNRFGNQAYRDWFGVDPQTMPGKHIREVIGEARYAANLPYIEAVLRGQAQRFERAIPTPDGLAVRHAQADYIPDIVDGEVQGFYVMVTDVTELKDSQRLLRDSEERYRTVVEGQTELVSRLKADGRYLYANEAYCHFFGKTPEQLIGKRWHPVAHPDDVPMIEQRLAELSPANPVVVIENRVHSAAGEVHWLQFVNRGFFDALGRLSEIQSVGRDVTARKLAEIALQEGKDALERRVAERTAELSQLAIELTLVEENERRAIARDLHDDLGQLLHVVKLKLDALSRRNKAPGLEPLLTQLDILVADASSRVRSLTGQLSPPVLERLGLVPALHWLSAELAEAYGLEVSIDADGQDWNLPFVESSILFRCIRELLINVARHAGSCQAEVSLSQRDEAGEILVADGGCGFVEDVGALRKAGHFGLPTIRERMAYLGGSMTLVSAPGQGTRVCLRIPLARRAR